MKISGRTREPEPDLPEEVPVTRNLCPRRFRWDAAERTLWTAVEGGMAGGVTWAADLPTWAMLPLMVLAALVKAYAAGKVGQPRTASTLSPANDPASHPEPAPLRTV